MYITSLEERAAASEDQRERAERHTPAARLAASEQQARSGEMPKRALDAERLGAEASRALDGRGAVDRAGRRRHAQAGQPRAGRQEPCCGVR